MEMVVDSLIRSQALAGHDVTLVTRWKQASALRKVSPDYPVIALPPRPSGGSQAFLDVGSRWPVAAAVAFHQLRHRFDIWHAHWLYPTGWMAESVLRPLGVPLVMTAHGADVNVDEEASYGFRQFHKHDTRVRDMLKRPCWTTGVSPDICDVLHDLDAKNIRCIPNGISFEGITARKTDVFAIRKSLSVSEDTFLLLTAARNVRTKGLHHIVWILKALSRTNLKIVWIIVGQNVEGLKQQFHNEGLSEQVRLLPAISKDLHDPSLAPPSALIDLYRCSDLFVFPTHNEAFGLVALEAMAAGTATIASDIGGLRSFMRSGENSLLVPQGDESAFADAIISLLIDPKRRQRLADQGQKTAQRYAWSKVSDSYLTFYHEVISETLK
ncbi:glycosyltransferase family 4 protein [Litorisediminicola beolgyonensis]|uniref:Glycosyltransferase family 4 protein n=1 Tax=Litorisediminicola beolgyonensis TaxID=1173614 RepID=A0ABW3ZLF6_9RHOB